MKKAMKANAMKAKAVKKWNKPSASESPKSSLDYLDEGRAFVERFGLAMKISIVAVCDSGLCDSIHLHHNMFWIQGVPFSLLICAEDIVGLLAGAVHLLNDNEGVLQ